MRGRFEDNADTRRFLFGIQRALSEASIKQPDERVSYSDAMKTCRFTASQMTYAVDVLVDAGLVTRSHEDADARRTHLVLSKRGRSVIGSLITSAQSVE
jgi:DNA-binding MarR family transcriptional regulator